MTLDIVVILLFFLSNSAKKLKNMFSFTLNQMNPCEKALLYVRYYDRSWQMISKLVFKTFCDRVSAVKIWWADFKRWFFNFEAIFGHSVWLRASANIELKLGKSIWKMFFLHNHNMKLGRIWWKQLFFLLVAKMEPYE